MLPSDEGVREVTAEEINGTRSNIIILEKKNTELLASICSAEFDEGTGLRFNYLIAELKVSVRIVRRSE